MSDRLSDEDLAELEHLESRATPWPWKWWTSNSYTRLGTEECGDAVAFGTKLHDGVGHISIADEDAAVLVAARNALPKLLAELRELRELRISGIKSLTTTREETGAAMSRLTSDELRDVAASLDDACAHHVAIRSLALHLAAVEAEREGCAFGHKAYCPVLSDTIGARCNCGGSRDDGTTPEKGGRAPSGGLSCGPGMHILTCNLCDQSFDVEALVEERDRMRAHLDRIEGALTDAETVEVHSDELWLSVQKLVEERDEARINGRELSGSIPGMLGEAIKVREVRIAQLEETLSQVVEENRQLRQELSATRALAGARDAALEEAANECEDNCPPESDRWDCARAIRALKGGAK